MPSRIREAEALPYDLVGIGNPVYDTIVTPWTSTSGRVLSGCSTNACLAAKRLGMAQVGLLGCLGPDYARRFTHDMKNYGIEAKVVSNSKETGGFHLIYSANGDRTLDVLGVAGKITPRDFPDEFLDCRFILVGPILGEVDLDLLQYIRSSTSALIFLDPQGLIRSIGADRRIIHSCNKNEFRRILTLVDFVKPNEHEAETITGEKDPVAAIRRLHEWGANVPAVTLAEQGSLVLNDNKLYHVPPYPTRAIDPTGAGDVYAGSFLAEYARKRDCVQAALFASAAASIKVEHSGPDFPLPVTEVQKRKEAIQGGLVVDRIA